MRARRWAWSRRGVPLALLLAAAALAAQPHPAPLESQPADAWIYAAMSDEPAVFTARPWGYRVLGPWLVHALPGKGGFVRLTRAALALAGVGLYLFLRRLGHGEVPSLAAVAAFGLSGPVAVGLEDPYLCEPMAVLCETGFLLAVASGSGTGVLALLGVLAALAKEIQLVLLPLVYLARREREGDRRALVSALLAALPALAVTLLMRLWWTPHLASPYPLPDASVLPLAIERLRQSWGRTGVLLGGLLPLAVLGALRTQARPFLRQYGYLAAAFLVLPWVAWMYDPRPGRVPFFGDTVRRLLIYALPLVIPLALVAIDRVLPHMNPRPPEPRRPRAPVEIGAALAAAALAALPLWGMDRYRRIEIKGSLLGPVVRAICRQSLEAAARIERGERVAFDPGEGRTRWFLRDGWGPYPFNETGDVVMRGRVGSLLLPCARPLDLDVSLSLSAPRDTALRVDVGSFTVGTLVVGPEAREQRLRVAAPALFRGDNLISLVATEDENPQIRFHGLALQGFGTANP